MKKAKVAKFASATENDGVNYREIAETMSVMGFQMEHSSARNYVLRIMTKFAKEIIKNWDVDVPEASIKNIVKSAQFQQGICEVLQKIEMQRRQLKGSKANKHATTQK